MPGTGYDDDAMRIGARSFTRGRRFWLMMLAVFAGGVALGAAVVVQIGPPADATARRARGIISCDVACCASVHN